MAANRKLVIEIERMLKKCNEGLDVLDGLWLKLEHVTSSYTYETGGVSGAGAMSDPPDRHGVGAELKEKKDKYENDLKKEIKKMQRARDQIRTWQSSDAKVPNEIIQSMEKMRKSIEMHMEKFKQTERMSKIKAFSTEGMRLQAEQVESLRSSDPRYGTVQWINGTIQKLQEMREVVDAELEAIESPSNKDNRLMVEELKEKRYFFDLHVEKLEMIMRLIDNDQIQTDLVDYTLKESFEYFCENHEEENSMELLDESIYDDLSLDVIENQVKVPTVAKSTSSSPPDKTDIDKDEKSLGSSSVSGTSTTDGSEHESQVAAKTNLMLKASKVEREKSTGKGQESQVPHQDSTSDYEQGARNVTSTSTSTTSKRKKLVPSDPSSMQSLGEAPATDIDDGGERQMEKPAWTNKTNTIKNLSSTASAPGVQESPRSDTSDEQHARQYKKDMHTRQYERQPDKPEMLNSNNRKQVQNTMTRMRMYYSSCLIAARRHMPTAEDMNITSSFESESSSQSHTWPVNPNPVSEAYIPESFPSVAIQQNDLPKILGKNLDTLFFCFYHQQNTYAQYLAAKELKRLGWRYHTGRNTWFQRHREPHTLTDTHEESDMMSFEFDVTPHASMPGKTSGWCQRLMKNFVFKYEFLEDEL